MADRNPNRRQLEYEEIQNRKKRQLERQREMQRRKQADYDTLTESQREQMEYRERKKRREAQQRRLEEEKKRKAQRTASSKRPRESAEILEERRRQARIPKNGSTSKTSGKKAKNKKAQNTSDKKIRASRRKKSVLGMILLVIQLLASLLFMFSVILLNILPGKYLAAIAGVLLVFALLVWLTQRHPKKRGIFGKLLSIVLSVLLFFGSYYVIKTNGLLSDIFGNNTKTNEMVVAVLKDDPAESLADTTNYSFGVQYANGAESTEAAVKDVQEQVGGAIEMAEYDSVQAQAQALMDGEIDALIYSSSYTSLMDDAVSGYSDNVKIIYKNKVTVDLGTTSGSVETITEPFSVYISGIDVYGDVAQNSRSDVNIIATVNPKTHQILLTSTPRDYYVTIPGVSDGEYDKLTHAGIYGVDTSIATLENLYDVDIDFYARLNFTSLINIVEELGGLDVYSEYTFTTSEDSGCVFDVVEGYNTLNGEQALAFARERQNVPGGDDQRGKDQQAVITAMIRKMLSPAMLIQANGLIDSLSGNIETSMSLDQMHGLVKSQLRTNAQWSITSVEPTGTYDSKYCYSAPGQPLSVTVPDTETVTAIAQQINQVEAGEALEGAETLN
ncbi:MAG: LCP family protein [Hespellia sp.]|nr:LCP family protein [Hespellia sp.]